MIAYITGKVISKTSNSVIIENNGIGYEVFIPLSTFYHLPDDRKEVSLYIYPHVKDETLSLFGFYSMLEKRLFLMLISVTGIGPRLAVNILSGIDPEDLLNAISKEDIQHLSRIPGVGRKTAKRMVLELKDKSTNMIISENIRQKSVRDHLIEDAISALVNLGYPQDMAERAIKKISARSKELNLESLIKESLRVIST